MSKITIDREVLEQAFDAIDAIDPSLLTDEASAAIREALAQPQQEPVGIVTTDCQEGPALIEAYQPIKAGATLYTSPQARKPLTGDQLHWMVMEHLGPLALTGGKLSVYDAFLKGIRATEAAHGIKDTP